MIIVIVNMLVFNPNEIITDSQNIGILWFVLNCIGVVTEAD